MTGLKRGTLRLIAEVNPDPEIEGNGATRKRSYITIKVGMSQTSFDVDNFIYIPTQGVGGLTYSCYGGDLNMQNQLTTARLWQRAIAPIDEQFIPLANMRINQVHSWGETKGYDALSCLSGLLWWSRLISPLFPTPAARKTLPPDPSNAAAIVETSVPGTTRVTFTFDGANPLEPNAPAITGVLSVLLRECDDEVFYSVSGSHDAFPAYMILIDGQPIYQYDPIASGGDPLSLFPPVEVLVFLDWTQL